VSVLNDPDVLLRLRPGELDLVLRVLRRLRMLGSVAHGVRHERSDCLSPRAIDQLASAKLLSDARARIARWELDRIAWALDDLPASVPLIALKGAAYLLADVPNARGRLFADIDLMVPEAYLGEVEGKLLERGWKAEKLSAYDDRYYRRWRHELPPLTHAERGVELDLHHNIWMRAGRLRSPATSLIEAARPVNGTRFHVLAPIDMTLHAMVHLFSGEMGGTLRELMDVDRLLRHHAAAEPNFWEDFWPRAVALRLTRPAFYGLRYAREIFGTPIPAQFMTTSRPHGPGAAVLALMDTLVPVTLLSSTPVRQPRSLSWARMLLYVRSHWLRMPAGLLAWHSLNKLWARVARSSG
jgi:hypothetical protein